jgi:hypothetical protein
MTIAKGIEVAMLKQLLGSMDADWVEAAVDALDGLESEELPVGHAVAASYLAAMRLKVRVAEAQGIRVRGWDSLHRELVGLNGDKICGVVFGSTVIVVLYPSLDQIIGGMIVG